MDAARHIILGLVFISLGFTAYAANAKLDPLWQLGSLMAVGMIASAGAVVFLWSALRRR